MIRTFPERFLARLVILLLPAALAGCSSYKAYIPEEASDSYLLSTTAEKPTPPGEESGELVQSRQYTGRKIHFAGHIGLLVSNPRTTIKKIADLVYARQGFVERINTDMMIVQVPANTFDATFKEIQGFGKVLKKTVTTEDITDQYRATELRLKIARTTRERLLALLKKASVEEDKLALLKQIEEVTATIETLEAQFELLKTKVRYSKITVTLTSYNQFDSRYRGYEPSGLYWINELAPLNDSAARAGDKLEFNDPVGMLHIKDRKEYWLAESGDKVFFRASRRDNSPKGAKAFWLDAIKLRLEASYKSAQSMEVGDYGLLRLVSYDTEPSIYYVGLKVDKDTLKLVELYFPSTALEEKYKNSIFDSIRMGET